MRRGVRVGTWCSDEDDELSPERRVSAHVRGGDS